MSFSRPEIGALLLRTMLCVATGAMSSTTFGQDGPLFYFAEAPGPHAVGLHVVDQYDYSRAYRRSTDELGRPNQAERARPLQTLVWYPANRSSSKPMTVGDYGNLWATETSFGASKMPAAGAEWLSGASPTLGMSLRAVRDAPAAPGRFPVVIYAPGRSSVAWENADLCEYLASNGYVVIAGPDMGVTTREMSMDLAGINAQASDISFLIGYSQTLPNTLRSGVAIVGHSWGGISSLSAAAHDSRIAALVALDGSMRYYPNLVQQAGDVHPEQMTIPMLYLAQGEITIEDQQRYLGGGELNAPSVLNAWTHGDLILVHMLGLAHDEFSSKMQRDQNWWRDSPQWMQKADYGREDGITGYAWVARYTLRFLDSYLKHDTAAAEFLKKTPAEVGAPRHFMTVSYSAATGIPSSFDGFREEIGRRGFGHAAEVLAAIRKEKSDFTLDESAITSWSDELISDNHLSEALSLLELNVQIHPDSTDAYSDLGDAYVKSGHIQPAIANYRKSLEKGSLDASVKRKLEALENNSLAARLPRP